MDVDLGEGLQAVAERLKVEPGDVLLLRFTRPLSGSQAAEFYEAARAALPDDLHVLVVEGSAVLPELVDRRCVLVQFRAEKSPDDGTVELVCRKV
jgi:hypothetical protein